jgi:myo-inositol-1(or 4)-monophosphatase
MESGRYSEVLRRIKAAIAEAKLVFSRYTPGDIAAEYKVGHDPVTQADKELDLVLRKYLLSAGEGWLSEESADDLSRLNYERVWVVDPLDGTREFVSGIPEFCISIGMVERGRPIAGGICNPVTGEIFLGCTDTGVTYNGSAARASQRASLHGATILASRSEVNRGEWDVFDDGRFSIQATGSVAYKLARVAAGLADATFTLNSKHEWDVAGGAALVVSGGGHVQLLNGSELICNRPQPIISGLVASGPRLTNELQRFLSSYSQG